MSGLGAVHDTVPAIPLVASDRTWMPGGQMLSRREFLAGLASLGAVSALDVIDVLHPFAAHALAASPGEATTLARTIRSMGAGPYFRLAYGEGEPYEVREDLARGDAKRTTRRRSVVFFAHLTDIHLIDSESPLRGEFLDQTSDPPSPAPFNSAWRPHEPLTLHVLESMVRQVNRSMFSPVTGTHLDFVLVTGDAADNAQFNEIRWFVDTLDGLRVAADSGLRGTYEGIQRMDYPNPLYWHPDDPSRDRYGLQHGFPAYPGLLEAAIRSFDTEGLRVPWFSVTGNHDILWQGNIPDSGPAAPPFAAIAVSPVKPEGGATADPDRRIVTTKEWVAEHFNSRAFPGPVGHGFTQENRDAGTGYYVRDLGPQLRLIVLDSVNPNGYANGSFDPGQIAWLEQQLIASHSRYRGSDGAWVTTPNRDRVLILTAHHTLYSTDNPLVATGTLSPEPRVLGGDVTTLLLRFPNVILYIGGHTHENRLIPHSSPDGGFWEVGTASHIDWPQQSRLVEILDNRDGTLSAFLTVLDHLAVPGSTDL
ncbi:MAG: metallophosphoesterase, partial [Actinomycetota bacterium]